MSRLRSVNVGLPRDIAWRGETVRTAVWKESVQGRRMVRRLNIDGDKQGDLAGHGGIYRCNGYLDHPFNNKPYKIEKDLLPCLQTEVGWCTIRRRHQHPHARTTILSDDGEASLIWLVF